MYEINGIEMPKMAYESIIAARRSGGRASIMLDECWTDSEYGMAYLCPNCRGTGEIVIEIITGGPSDTPISTNPFSNEKKDRPVETTTWIEGSWYKRVLHEYVCPPCLGTGRVQQPAKRPERVRF